MREEISLHEILKQLYTISGILINVYNLKGESLASYPDQGALFCQMVNECPQGRCGCKASNEEGFRLVQKKCGAAIYKCHMGLYEAVVPLYHYGTLAGYMMTGQILEKGDHAKKAVINRAEKLSLGTPEQIQEAVSHLVQIDEKNWKIL